MNPLSSSVLQTILIASAALTLAACEVGPDYQKPETALPVTWLADEARAADAKASVDQQWWNNFHDPVLTQLIERATTGNLDIKIAETRILEARAQVASADAALLPTGDVKSTATREANQFAFPGGAGNPFGSLLKKPFNSFQNGFDASWELDLFGGNRRAAEAASAQMESSEASRDDVMVSLMAEVARTYVDIRQYQAQLAIVEDTLASDRKALDIAQQRFHAGDAPGIDKIQAESALEQAQTQLPLNRNLLAQAEYSMDVLIGEQPGATHALVAQAAPIPVSNEKLLLAAPASVIAQRPDIRVSERKLAAATGMQGVAVAKFFPDISLSGFFGSLTTDGSQILHGGSQSWLASGGITWPILSYGSLSANLDSANAQQQEAMADYQKTILGALSDVERSLAAYNEQRKFLHAASNAVEKDRHARDIAQERYKNGLTSFIDVLDADRTLFASQDQLTKARAEASQDLIAVYKSLGGGWKREGNNL
jgi:NodT family efflux transporter outer membrane factor (OMF) lipoprotein